MLPQRTFSVCKGLLVVVGLVVLAGISSADKIIDLHFNPEQDGLSTVNSGTSGGIGVLDKGFPGTTPDPEYTGNVPTGPYAPVGNRWAIDFKGKLEGGARGRGIDFPHETIEPIIGLSAFTVTGWINARDDTIGCGGNRIVSIYPARGGAGPLTGFDVVHERNGTIRLGVNQAPDWPNPPGDIGPRSSPGVVPVDPAAPPENWIFFAITYDAGDLDNSSDGEVHMYFGDGSTPAEEDLGVENSFYDRGAIVDPQVGLTIGNFPPDDAGGTPRDADPATDFCGDRAQRAFRGLIDEIQFHDRVLTLEEIRAIQKEKVGEVVETVPCDLVLSCEAVRADLPFVRVTIERGPTGPCDCDKIELTFDGAEVPDVSLTLEEPTAEISLEGYQPGSEHEISVVCHYGAEKGKPASCSITVPEPLPHGKLIDLHFDDAGDGISTVNSGTAGGVGILDVGTPGETPPPEFSDNVPTGPFAPKGNLSSIDFKGKLLGGAKGRGIDFPPEVAYPLQGLSEFTILGWINVRDDTIGCGGNRIFTTWPGRGAGGGALSGIDVVYERNGTLRLGVNQAPDWPNPPGDIGPRSSPGMVPTDPEAGPDNWVFFAITYDAGDPEDPFDGQVHMYFGNGSMLAAEDLGLENAFYDRGVVENPKLELTIGNFIPSVGGGLRDVDPNDRCGQRAFRGLVDEIQFHDSVLTLEEIQDIQTEDLGGGTGKPLFKRGDANADGSINIADAIFILSFLFAGDTQPVCFDAADSNDDGGVDIADAIAVLANLFGGAGDLPPPYNACGEDPTEDALSECNYPEEKC